MHSAQSNILINQGYMWHALWIFYKKPFKFSMTVYIDLIGSTWVIVFQTGLFNVAFSLLNVLCFHQHCQFEREIGIVRYCLVVWNAGNLAFDNSWVIHGHDLQPKCVEIIIQTVLHIDIVWWLFKHKASCPQVTMFQNPFKPEILV